MICYASSAFFVYNILKVFDISHAFLRVIIAELSTLKQVWFFWPTLYVYWHSCIRSNAHIIRVLTITRSTFPRSSAALKRAKRSFLALRVIVSKPYYIQVKDPLSFNMFLQTERLIFFSLTSDLKRLFRVTIYKSCRGAMLIVAAVKFMPQSYDVQLPSQLIRCHYTVILFLLLLNGVCIHCLCVSITVIIAASVWQWVQVTVRLWFMLLCVHLVTVWLSIIRGLTVTESSCVTCTGSCRYTRRGKKVSPQFFGKIFLAIAENSEAKFDTFVAYSYSQLPKGMQLSLIETKIIRFFLQPRHHFSRSCAA